jgi:hypothetical protein
MHDECLFSGSISDLTMSRLAAIMLGNIGFVLQISSLLGESLFAI